MLFIELFGLNFFIGTALGAVLVAGYVYVSHSNLMRSKKYAKLILKEAEEKARLTCENLIRTADKEVKIKKNKLDLDFKEKKIELNNLELDIQRKQKVLEEKKTHIDSESRRLEEKQVILNSKEKELESKEEVIKNSHQTLVEKLEKISHMTKQEAKDSLFETLKNEVELENQQWISKELESARLKAKDESAKLLCSVMQRYVAEQVTPNSSGVVSLPNEEMKGRIIGKEGRNIKALEMSTGMEFVIGEGDSGTITISGFNPIRREVAKSALKILIEDGRINPSRIEEVTAKCEAKIEELMEEVGQQTILEFGFSGVNAEIIKLLGALQFRTSYTQNVLVHSKETGIFARMIAEELGLNGTIAARCGLLHDIGKAVSHEVEGPHALVGADIAKKYGESAIVVNAIASHHEEANPTSIYAIITMIADTISASRVGARKETLATYIKRIECLEEIATSFHGVKKAYALQAGREVRIIVDSNEVDDSKASVMARDIAKKVEAEMNFPGQIKINVIREKRSVVYAK